MFGKNIEAYILLERHNRRYFLGVDTSFGCAIITKKQKAFVTDFRYSAFAKDKLGDTCEVVTCTGQNFYAQIAAVLNRLGVMKVGFDETCVTVEKYDAIKKALTGVSLFKCGDILAAQRAVKTDEEIVNITEAQRIAERALGKVLPLIKPGITERELRAELVYACLAEGAEGMSFEPIIAFGEASAYPHYMPGDTRLEKNDIILLDFGCR